MRNKPLTVLHVTYSLLRQYGGPATSVPSLCRALSGTDCKVSLLTAKYNPDDVEFPGTTNIIQYGKKFGLNGLIKNADIIHFHEVWPLLNNRVMRLCRLARKKYIVAPRSSLMVADINKTYFKTIKKVVAWEVYVKNNFHGAAGFHVTAENEFYDLSRIGFNTAAAIIPNGVSAEFGEKGNGRLFHEMFPNLIGKRIVLFYSRIAPKKGLLLLAHAWGRLAKKNSSWKLLIVGPDEGNHWSSVKSVLDSYDEKSYTRCGYLSGEKKVAVMQSADLFVLPSLWENFGIVVAEALMAGTAVITTTATPWTQLDFQGCGWTIEPEKDALVNALEEAMHLPPQALNQMGRKGHLYVSRTFNWYEIAKKIRLYYEYILKIREKPYFVYPLSGDRRLALPIQKPIQGIRASA